MSNSITLSPKHGVNATIPVCFFCGEEKNEIALLGRIYERDKHTGKKVPGSDLEAPMKMVLDYQPCDCCAAKFKQGVLLIGVSEMPFDNRPPMTAKGGAQVYPTGSYAVVKPRAVKEIFNLDMSEGDTTFVDQRVMEQVFHQ